MVVPEVPVHSNYEAVDANRKQDDTGDHYPSPRSIHRVNCGERAAGGESFTNEQGAIQPCIRWRSSIPDSDAATDCRREMKDVFLWCWPLIVVESFKDIASGELMRIAVALSTAFVDGCGDRYHAHKPVQRCFHAWPIHAGCQRRPEANHHHCGGSDENPCPDRPIFRAYGPNVLPGRHTGVKAVGGKNLRAISRDISRRRGVRTPKNPASGVFRMGTALSSREEQVQEVLDRLYEVYPDPTISLEFSTRLELLVAVILSAQCTDTRVNDVTADLFEKYTTPEAYAEADEAELAEDLYSITYHNSKANYLKSACQQILAEHDGEIPDTMAALTALPGVGRKTANVVLQHGHDLTEGIVVDTHVQRLSQRLGLTEEPRPDAIEQALLPIVPEDDWKEFTHLLINHGRATCTAQNPACTDCILEDICPSSRLDNDIDLADDTSW